MAHDPGNPDAQELSFWCPFPGCGKIFLQQNGLTYHLQHGLKHHGQNVPVLEGDFHSTTANHQHCLSRPL